jgi:uncharacterized protein (DUF4415 family)
MSRKNAPGYVPNPDYTQEDWNEVSDNPEWTAEDFAKARPFAEVFPEMAAAIKRGRGKQKTPTKELTAIRLDRATLDAFRATGPGWQTRIDAILKKAAKNLR